MEPTQVLGILNGHDDRLNLFWNSDREQFYSALRTAGIRHITGPTFSILGEPGVPASHNVLASRQHHRVVQELHDRGVVAIPNVYWRGERERDEWLNHLQANDVAVISRDFTRTKHSPQFDVHWGGLLDLVSRVGKPIHVVVLGVGIAKVRIAAGDLHEAGASCTFVTPQPIVQAMQGGRGFAKRRGRMVAVYQPNVSKRKLALGNLNTFQRVALEGCRSRVQTRPPVTRRFDYVGLENRVRQRGRRQEVSTPDAAGSVSPGAP